MQRSCAYAAIAAALSFWTTPAFANHHRGTLAELGYGAEQLSTESDRVEFWQELPGNWLLEEGSAFELAYSHPAATQASSAEVVVTINGQEAHRFTLGATGVPLAREQVPIPSFRPVPAGLHVVVEYFPRGDEVGCVAPDERVLVVREISAFDIQYSLRPADEDLAALPYPLSWQRAREPISVTFVVPARREGFEVDAAARIASWLGQQAGGSPFHFETILDEEWTQETMRATNTVVLASEALTLPDFELGCSDIASATDPSFGLCRSSTDAHFGVLWVAGADEEAMSSAVEALVTRSGELRGRISAASDLGDAEEETMPWSETRTSFADLDVSEVMFRGLGEQVRSFYFRRPRGWQLGEDSRLSIHVSVAAEAETSIQVSINGNELGQFGPHDVEDEYIHVQLPSGPSLNRDDQGRPADYLVLAIKVTQRLADQQHEDCDPRSEEAWTLIHGDSYFDIVAAEPDLPDLYWFPFPFTRPNASRATSLVVSRASTPEELSAGLTVAAELGRSALGELPVLRVLRTNEWTERSGHVVLLGTAASRGWLRAQGPSAPELVLERLELPPNAPIEAPVGQLIAAQTEWDGQLLVLEADSGHLVTVAEALHRSQPSGLQMLVDANSQAMTIHQTPGGGFRDLTEFGERIAAGFRFGPLHWLFVATNIATLLLWWQAARRRKSRTH